MRHAQLGIAAALATLLTAGCTPQSRQDYTQASQEAAKAIKTDAKATSAAAKAATEAAKRSLQKSSSGSDGSVAATADQATKVKSALDSAPGLDAKAITVAAAGNTVTLAGKVPTDKQKTQAMQVAQGAAASGTTIQDSLVVAP